MVIPPRSAASSDYAVKEKDMKKKIKIINELDRLKKDGFEILRCCYDNGCEDYWHNRIPKGYSPG